MFTFTVVFNYLVGWWDIYSMSLW